MPRSTRNNVNIDKIRQPTRLVRFRINCAGGLAAAQCGVVASQRERVKNCERSMCSARRMMVLNSSIHSYAMTNLIISEVRLEIDLVLYNLEYSRGPRIENCIHLQLTIGKKTKTCVPITGEMFSLKTRLYCETL